MSGAARGLRLGFAGTPRFAIAPLDALVQSRHRVVAVFTQPDRPAGRGRAMTASPIKQHAEGMGLPVLQPVSFKSAEAIALLAGLELDALVVVAYGLILPGAVLSVPRLGCFNIHASCLPRWRGAAPIQRALLAGDTITGVTIMRMDAGLDTGPMLAMRTEPIRDRDTAGTLHERLARVGADLLLEVLDALASGRAQAEPQPDQGVTYASKIDKREARLDWRADASRLLRQIRAFNPWPVADTTLHGAPLKIWEAELAPPDVQAAARAPGTILDATSRGVDVQCGKGALRLLRLQRAGRNVLHAEQFVSGQGLIGEVLGDP